MRLHPFRCHSSRARARRAGGGGALRRGQPDEAAALARGNPHSFLHVGRSDIDLPDDVDPYDPRIYAQRARGAGPVPRARAPCSATRSPSLYLYRQIMDGRAQVGVVGCVHVDDYEHDVIRKHEKTRPDKEDDRTRHVLTLNANAEPVFLTYRGRPEIDALGRGRYCGPRRCTTSPRPTGCGTPSGGSPTPGRWLEAFEPVPHAYVADGHHRSASAWRAGKELRAANPRHRGDEEYNWFLAVLFPADAAPHPALQPGGARPGRARRPPRCSARLGARRAGARRRTTRVPRRPGQLRRLPRRTRGTGWSSTRPASTGPIRSARSTCRCCRTGCWARSSASATRAPTSGSTSWAASGARRSWSGGCDSGEMAIAFSLYPTTLEQLMAVSDAGQVMPPKSTWFEPKLRSGLFVHTL